MGRQRSASRRQNEIMALFVSGPILRSRNVRCQRPLRVCATYERDEQHPAVMQKQPNQCSKQRLSRGETRTANEQLVRLVEQVTSVLSPIRLSQVVEKQEIPGLPEAWRRNLAAAAVCLALFVAPHPSANALSDAQKLVAEAWRVVDQAYVDKTFNKHDWFAERQRAVKKAYADVDDGRSAIRDLLAKLDDPYTRLLTPAQHAALRATATGELSGGVGVLLSPDSPPRIAAPPDEDTPAAGLHVGDVLVAVDGEDVTELTPDEVAARIRGMPGTDVTLTLQSDAGKVSLRTMTRTALRLKTVSARREGDVGVVRLKGFNERTANDVREALTNTVGDAKKVVLDLRGNPGGYFAGGVDVARLFLHSGEPIVYVVDRNGITDEMDCYNDGPWADVPLTVVVDENTASASEILAGALLDNKRATLVGTKTFGKGVVQTVTPLSDGGAVSVTIARYETPNKVDINKRGIEPMVRATCGEDVLECVGER